MSRYILLAAFLLSCNPYIMRWSIHSNRGVSSEVSIKKNKNIFDDFLWTTPDIRSTKIRDNFNWNGIPHSFEVIRNKLILTVDGRKYTFDKKLSKGKYYHNISELKSISVSKNSWVPKTTTVFETVPVHKTRQVHKTTVGANGIPTTVFETEVYVDHETRSVTKTEWKWETHFENTYKIPDISYFDIECGTEHFIIYEIKENNLMHYYLQNPEYYIATEKSDSTFGTKDVRLIFIDANSNGIFFEEMDRMLFNVWNPYDKTSEYQTIPRLMDNYWYTVSEIKNNYFLSFSLNNDLLKLEYENEKYLGENGTGELIINNTEDLDAKIIINGEEYSTLLGSKFNSDYGKFRIIISVPNHVDYEEVYIIDKENPVKVINYTKTAPAGILKIVNIFASQFRIHIQNSFYNKTFYNVREINLPRGTYKASLFVDGYTLVKDPKIEENTPYVIDFEKEIKK